MATENDFYETPAANELAEAYQANKNHNDILILVCLFFVLYI